jgi:hypothetical protein
MIRTQYTRVRCGACGKRGAYLLPRYGNYDAHGVRCIYCKADRQFPRYAVEGYVTWPGTLEAAAAMLREEDRS